MSSLNNLLYLYLELNLIFIFSALLWIVFTRVFKNQSPMEHRLRLAQLLILVSIVSPIVLIIIPQQHLPVIEFSDFYPVREDTSNAIVKTASKLFTSSNNLYVQPTLPTKKNIF